MSPEFTIQEVTSETLRGSDIDVFILAAGFEDRALEFISRFDFSKDSYCVLSLFENQIDGNVEVEKRFVAAVSRKFDAERVRSIRLAFNEVYNYRKEFRELLHRLPHNCTKICVDVSGFPAYAICAILEEVREFRPFEDVLILYTAALHYTPTLEMYHEMIADGDLSKDVLPPSMAREMSENLTFAPFTGNLRSEGRTCLALFAGYEPHRSAGVIESLNPSMLLMIYGDPSDSRLSWRLELSKKLHERFTESRKTAEETVATHSIERALEVLEQYYHFLVDEYDFILSPICSKLQVVACFLFWERHQEVQLTFPLPIGYDPTHRPTGCGRSFFVRLRSRVRFGA